MKSFTVVHQRKGADMTELRKLYLRNEEILKNLKSSGVTIATVGIKFIYDLLMQTNYEDRKN